MDVIYGGSLRQNNLLAEGIYFRQTLRLAAHAAFVVVNDMVWCRGDALHAARTALDKVPSLEEGARMDRGCVI